MNGQIHAQKGRADKMEGRAVRTRTEGTCACARKHGCPELDLVESSNPVFRR